MSVDVYDLRMSLTAKVDSMEDDHFLSTLCLMQLS